MEQLPLCRVPTAQHFFKEELRLQCFAGAQTPGVILRLWRGYIVVVRLGRFIVIQNVISILCQFATFCYLPIIYTYAALLRVQEKKSTQDNITCYNLHKWQFKRKANKLGSWQPKEIHMQLTTMGKRKGEDQGALLQDFDDMGKQKAFCLSGKVQTSFVQLC